MIVPALWALVVLAALVIQASLLPLFSYRGIEPDILLIITVSAGLLYGREQGVGIGFFAGLLQDLASGGIFGLNTLPKLLIGYCAGAVERKVFKEHILLPLSATAAATAVNYVSMLLLLLIFGYKVDFVSAIVRNLLPLIFCNMVFSVPIHWLVHKLGRLDH